MKNETSHESLFRQALDPAESELAPPDAGYLQACRDLVRSKAAAHARDPVIAFARFLNQKIRLYHAIAACVVVTTGAVYFAGRERPEKSSAEQATQVHSGDLVAARDGTVLSSISTFVLKQ